jgi:hypothetical protein
MARRMENLLDLTARRDSRRVRRVGEQPAISLRLFGGAIVALAAR